MAKLTLTKTRLIGGIWEGQLKGVPGEAPPDLRFSLDQETLDGLQCGRDAQSDCWFVRAPVPADRISDGIQTFVISDAASGETLASFALFSGEIASDDMQGEVSLLRAELDMLKSAFRRHCLETM